jgi:DNA-binding MarR family transcriptional regulator
MTSKAAMTDIERPLVERLDGPNGSFTIRLTDEGRRTLTAAQCVELATQLRDYVSELLDDARRAKAEASTVGQDLGT